MQSPVTHELTALTIDYGPAAMAAALDSPISHAMQIERERELQARFFQGAPTHHPKPTGTKVQDRVSSAENITVFNNWAVVTDPWEDWGSATTGFSLGLSTQVVPEPSTCAMAIVGLACGGYSLFRRRHAR